VTHRRQRFSWETVGRTRVSPVRQHEVDQQAMLVDSSKQVLPLSADLHIGLVHAPGGRTVALIPPDSLLKLTRACGEL
jgi:hypothetical protein